MKSCFSLIVFILINCNISAQTVYEDSWLTISSEDGVCYADAFETDIYEFEEKEYFVFTGQEQKEAIKNDIDIVTVVGLVVPKSKWTKINRISDCLSADPMDCIRERRRSDYYGIRYTNKTVITDTSQVKEFQKKILKTATLIEKRNGIKKVNVLCGVNLTQEMQQAIIDSLQSKGYLASGFTNVQNRLVKEAVFLYQIHHSLPLGYLDMETLSSLKVLEN